MSNRVRVALEEQGVVHLGAKAATSRILRYVKGYVGDGEAYKLLEAAAPRWKGVVELLQALSVRWKALHPHGPKLALKLWVWREPRGCRRQRSSFLRLVDERGMERGKLPKLKLARVGGARRGGGAALAGELRAAQRRHRQARGQAQQQAAVPEPMPQQNNLQYYAYNMLEEAAGNRLIFNQYVPQAADVQVPWGGIDRNPLPPPEPPPPPLHDPEEFWNDIEP